MKRALSMAIAFLLFAICESAFAADTGSCGPTCEYTYDPITQTLTYRGTGVNGAGEIAYSSSHYNLSGIVKNAIISEGITRVYQGSSDASTIRNIGTQDGKLVIPSTMESFEPRSSYLLGFGTVEINSKNANFSSTSLQFKSEVNATIVLAADANVNIQNSLFNADHGRNYYPSTLTVSCKGNPDACMAKFGISLDNMDQANVSADYYKMVNDDGSYEEWNDTGFAVYADPSKTKLLGKYSPDGTQTGYYKYDGAGNLVQAYENGKQIYAKKSILRRRRRLPCTTEMTMLCR